ncbi:MAG: alpha/beta-type small acid-soluble spore protein [Clostridia bacterium]|nr:alpha/beta-type small acid-soluble spore protein [Clostridia bacterium]
MNPNRNGSSSNGSNSSNNNNSGSKANKKNMQSFKTEVANSMNVNLKKGYNGDLTSREAGSVGGEMVKRMIAYAQDNMKDNGAN